MRINEVLQNVSNKQKMVCLKDSAVITHSTHGDQGGGTMLSTPAYIYIYILHDQATSSDESPIALDESPSTLDDTWKECMIKVHLNCAQIFVDR
jgi:hypothetical protein